MRSQLPKSFHLTLFGAALLLILLGLALWQVGVIGAAGPSPLHPDFPLLDAEGNKVLDTGAPVSTMVTCGQCHDTAFIAEHSGHADAGLSSYGSTGLHAWDQGDGPFGAWDPITYRYLSAEDDARIDLGTAEWVQVYGERHVGGGPAESSRAGGALTESTLAVDTTIIDPTTGQAAAWDWSASGSVEMNCFLCHTSNPDNAGRIAALQDGDFAWASTATLQAAGISRASSEGYRWNENAFDEAGNVLPELIGIQDPNSEACGQCHGVVHLDPQDPLVFDPCDSEARRTLTTGQVVSPQRISNSGMNLAGKEEIARSWDVHAERVVNCVDCHYATNNPVYYQEREDRPEHLVFDPRRADFGEYLERPLHQFANSDNAGVACESCHNAAVSHQWLPYQQRHTDALACESCHINQTYAPALQYVDWTVLRSDSSPVTVCRGVEGDLSSPANALISGYEPVLLPVENIDGSTELAPHNLVTAWYWVYGETARPVAYRDLQAAYFEGEAYAAEVVESFDADGDGSLSSAELQIDSEDKEALITGRLEALGLTEVRIEGEVIPYALHHGVGTGDWATRDCRACHSDDSRVTQGINLADRSPGGVSPSLLNSSTQAGEVILNEGGLRYLARASAQPSDIYILGHDNAPWIDWAGIIAIAGVTLGVFGHGALRYLSVRQQANVAPPELKRVYMYSVYERLWHWLQTTAILLLIFTGLVIHKPDLFAFISFRWVVAVHNVLAAILVINAALSLFYHLASGEIKQFIPRPYGFFDQSITQAMYYLRGIFKGDPHPFEKSPEQKMNPLQQMTYLAILNVLLPLQIITGAMMWGAQRWPELANRLGGLPFLAPFHTIIAWLFVAFIIMHVYLTTTGPTPLAAMQAMVMGWEEVEAHEAHEARGE